MPDSESQMFDERFERFRRRFETSRKESLRERVLETESRRSAYQEDFEQHRSSERDCFADSSSRASAEAKARQALFDERTAAMSEESELLDRKHGAMEQRMRRAPRRDLLAKAGVPDLEDPENV